MAARKRKPGRPKVGTRYPIQKHIFLDEETAEMLRALGAGNESGYLRELIQREYRKREAKGAI